MDFNSVIINIVICVVVESMLKILVPEGRMKSFVLSVVSLVVFSMLCVPIFRLVESL